MQYVLILDIHILNFSFKYSQFKRMHPKWIVFVISTQKTVTATKETPQKCRNDDDFSTVLKQVDRMADQIKDIIRNTCFLTYIEEALLPRQSTPTPSPVSGFFARNIGIPQKFWKRIPVDNSLLIMILLGGIRKFTAKLGKNAIFLNPSKRETLWN